MASRFLDQPVHTTIFSENTPLFTIFIQAWMTNPVKIDLKLSWQTIAHPCLSPRLTTLDHHHWALLSVQCWTWTPQNSCNSLYFVSLLSKLMLLVSSYPTSVVIPEYSSSLWHSFLWPHVSPTLVLFCLYVLSVTYKLLNIGHFIRRVHMYDYPRLSEFHDQVNVFLYDFHMFIIYFERFACY